MLINKTEYKLDIISKQKKESLKKFKGLKNKLCNNKPLGEKDFDIANEFDVSLVVLDKIVTYLNIYNVNIFNGQLKEVSDKQDKIKETNQDVVLDVLTNKESLLAEILKLKCFTEEEVEVTSDEEVVSEITLDEEVSNEIKIEDSTIENAETEETAETEEKVESKQEVEIIEIKDTENEKQDEETEEISAEGEVAVEVEQVEAEENIEREIHEEKSKIENQKLVNKEEKNQENVTELVSEESEDEDNTSNETNKIDLFNAQSFELELPVKKKKTEKVNSYVDNIEIIKNGLKELNLNYEELNDNCKNNLIKISNLDEYNLLVNYFKDKSVNLSGDAVCTIFSSSNSKTVAAVYNLLTKYENVTVEYLDNLINQMPLIFTNKGYTNLLKVLDILKKYEDVNRENIILNNPVLLVTDSDKVKDIIKIIEKFNLDINDTLVNRWIIMLDENKINKNLEILKTYSIDPSYIDKDTFMILLNDNLPFILDHFIELNMNDYIHEDESLALRKIKTLIIKRIYYAYKNKLFVWKSPLLDNSYEIIINKDYNVLNESDIKELINRYPSLEMIEEGNRITIYSENSKTIAKRKCELIFNKKIVSRIKTYSIFECLTKNGIEEKEALLYAISYNSYLETFDMEEIKKYINAIWRSDN